MSGALLISSFLPSSAVSLIKSDDAEADVAQLCCAELLSCVWLFAAPRTVTRQTPVLGILQASILDWAAMPSSRGSFQLRDPTQVSHIARRFFTLWANREAQTCWGWGWKVRHFLLGMHVCMLSHFSQVWLFVSPGTVACQVPLSMEFSRQEHWSVLPSPFPRGPSQARDRTASYVFPALQVDSLPLLPPGSPHTQHESLKQRAVSSRIISVT